MWLTIFVIILLVAIATAAFSASFRGILVSLWKLVWKLIKKIADKIGVPVFLVVIGILALGLAIFLMVLLIGYETNANWLLRPLILFNVFMLLLTVMTTKWRNGALIFMWLLSILLFAEADVVIFKTNIYWFGLYAVVSLAFAALGIYTKKITNAAGYTLMTVIVITAAFGAYTHLDKDRWEAARDNYLTKRGINTSNLKSETRTLKNGWKFSEITPIYKIVVTDDNGKIVDKPEFRIEAGETIVVDTSDPANTTVPANVAATFRNMPVYKIGSADFNIKTTYWILQANVSIRSDLKKKLTSSLYPSESVTVSIQSTSFTPVVDLNPGDAIWVYNAGTDTVYGQWGKWPYKFPPREHTPYKFTGFQPGRTMEVRNKDGHKEESILTIQIYRKQTVACGSNCFLFFQI